MKQEEKRRRGRPSKQITVYNEKKVNKDNKPKKDVQKKIVEIRKEEIIIEEQIVVDEKTQLIENPTIIEESIPDDKVSYSIDLSFLDKIKKYELPKDKYYDEVTDKKQIVLHHTTSGPGYKSDINYYLRSNDKISTHYLIERNGNIINIIDPDAWCHHLKITNNEFRNFELDNMNVLLNKSSISIDLDSWGELTKVNDNRYKNSGGIPITVLKDDVSYYESGFRGSFYYQRYTVEQLESLKKLLIYLSNKYNIPLTYKGDIMFDTNKNALSGESGVWTHVSYRLDVKNCHPDANLIEMLKSF